MRGGCWFISKGACVRDLHDQLQHICAMVCERMVLVAPTTNAIHTRTHLMAEIDDYIDASQWWAFQCIHTHKHTHALPLIRSHITSARIISPCCDLGSLHQQLDVYNECAGKMPSRCHPYSRHNSTRPTKTATS